MFHIHHGNHNLWYVSTNDYAPTYASVLHRKHLQSIFNLISLLKLVFFE